MNPTIVIPGLFIIFLIALAALYRKSTLKHLALLTGEDFIFEESPVAVQQHAGVRIVHFGTCMVKISRQRLIIAQKMPLTKKSYFIRFMIVLGNSSTAMDLKETLKKGYVVAETIRGQITEARDDARSVITIPISDSRFITMAVKNGSDCMRALRGL
jgi:hypothetical protein